MEDIENQISLNKQDRRIYLKNKRFFLILFSPFVLLICNYWNETYIISFIMQYKNFDGIGILGLNFTIEGGDLFFFFYNFLIITIIIVIYSLKGVFQEYNIEEINYFKNINKKLTKYSEIAFKVVVIITFVEMFNFVLRFMSLIFYVDSGLLILHFILDLVFNISIIISFASYLLTRIKLNYIKNI